MAKLIYAELSFKIVGILFDVYNQLRYGHKEKVYQKALIEEFKRNRVNFQRELYFPIEFKGRVISSYYFDFLVENKIVLELKVANDFYQKDMNQLLSYLKFKGYRLGLLVIFTHDQLKCKRIVN
ncbi:MAG: GxxExxY protein [Candidatus Berkelbacteria bacterium]|nr:GxxExxY protein [Candidatus Berkelbacteria bacterium]